jgi:glycerol-3-phosphate dehydrogenase (NAD(P)+)
VSGSLAAALGTPSFRIYGNDDPVGAEVGGAAKNVVAIAAGAVIGAGLGENARAALVTGGLAELARLAVALGGRADTVAGVVTGQLTVPQAMNRLLSRPRKDE